jgi:hypothetical protein
MSDAEASLLRRALSSHAGGRGRRYPRVLRERIVAYAQVRRSESASWARIAAELRLQLETVRRWCLDAKAVVASRAILPVEVVADERPSLTVVAPSGVRIEGVTRADAIAVLRELG